MALGLSLGLRSATALAGCGDDDDDASDVAEANAAFCDELVAYGTVIGNVAALESATATKGDYESSVDEVRLHAKTWSTALRTSAKRSGEPANAGRCASGPAPRCPRDQTVQSILDQEKPGAAAVQANIATLNTAVCTTGTATTSGT